ncbi:MAG: hypothetical protein A2252_01515 [Elusimicrobia bacterium RIFOXYA2_FULL_39_19]|nr:MAG: hypothetical protein A2252_01515 [Elusimicrobia bacterium RIFOXYA2_FULL_39_19]
MPASKKISMNICKRCDEDFPDIEMINGMCLHIFEKLEGEAPSCVPNKHKYSRFSNFQQISSDHTQMLNFCRDQLANNLSIYLAGRQGCGKSHLAAACASELNRLGRDVVYNTFAEYLYSLADPSYDDKMEAEKWTLKHYASNEYVILDDVGQGHSISKLSPLVSRLYDENRNIVITSNLNIEQLAQEIGSVIPSRLTEMCGGKDKIMYFDLLDYRLLTRAEKDAFAEKYKTEAKIDFPI